MDLHGHKTYGERSMQAICIVQMYKPNRLVRPIIDRLLLIKRLLILTEVAHSNSRPRSNMLYLFGAHSFMQKNQPISFIHHSRIQSEEKLAKRNYSIVLGFL